MNFGIQNKNLNKKLEKLQDSPVVSEYPLDAADFSWIILTCDVFPLNLAVCAESEPIEDAVRIARIPLKQRYSCRRVPLPYCLRQNEISKRQLIIG